jgi:DNA helicase MCM8
VNIQRFNSRILLRRFYLKLRARSSGAPDDLPVTMRTLESLARLCEARARAELRESASAADAEDVVELMQEALGDAVFTGDAPDGAFAPPGAGGRAAGGARGEARRLLSALAAEAARDERSAAAKGGYFSYAEIAAVADRIALNVPDLEQFVARLNDAGELLAHGRLYRVRPGAVPAGGAGGASGAGGGYR